MRKINQGIAMKINEADQGHRLLKIQICTIMAGDLKAEAIVDMDTTGTNLWVETTVRGKVVFIELIGSIEESRDSDIDHEISNEATCYLFGFPTDANTTDIDEEFTKRDIYTPRHVDKIKECK